MTDVTGQRGGLNLKVTQAQGFYGIIALGMVIGLLNNVVGLINPVKLLVVASVLNGIVAVPIIAALALIAGSKQIMGEYRSGWLSSSLVWLACLGMAAAVVALLLSTL